MYKRFLRTHPTSLVCILIYVLSIFTSLLFTFMLSGCERKSSENIWYAVMHEDLPALKRMVDNGANVNARDDGGDTPLHYAVTSRNVKIVRYLLAHGAQVNVKSGHSGYSATPLHKAAEFDNEEIISDLIAAGADINAKDDYGNTPLHYAATSVFGRSIPILMAHGANWRAKNQYGDYPITRALKLNKTDVVRVFMKYCKNPEQKSSKPLNHKQNQ